MRYVKRKLLEHRLEEIAADIRRFEAKPWEYNHAKTMDLLAQMYHLSEDVLSEMRRRRDTGC